jgi:hypothetical protein
LIYVDLPIQDADFPLRYVKLPEGKLIEVMPSSSFNNGVKHGTP